MERNLKQASDMTLWHTSPAHKEITNFIKDCNAQLAGRPLSDLSIIKVSSWHFSYRIEERPILAKYVSLLHDIKNLAESIPLDPPSATRYGNMAFRRFIASVNAELLSRVADVELRTYLLESLGNPIRIDYGTGHELMFVCFLIVLWNRLKEPQSSTMEPNDHPLHLNAASSGKLPPLLGSCLNTEDVDVSLVLFSKYLEVCRCIQLRFRLEPAGSHGVWGLDDFQFLPFLWGSAQLMDGLHGTSETLISPSAAVPKDSFSMAMIQELSKDYLYFGGIRFICIAKPVEFFARHSQLLYSISALGSWAKINEGLLKMYFNEVLGKFPVVRMMPFGDTLRWQEPHSSPGKPTGARINQSFKLSLNES